MPARAGRRAATVLPPFPRRRRGHAGTSSSRSTSAPMPTRVTPRPRRRVEHAFEGQVPTPTCCTARNPLGRAWSRGSRRRPRSPAGTTSRGRRQRSMARPTPARRHLHAITSPVDERAVVVTSASRWLMPAVHGAQARPCSTRGDRARRPPARAGAERLVSLGIVARVTPRGARVTRGWRRSSSGSTTSAGCSGGPGGGAAGRDAAARRRPTWPGSTCVPTPTTPRRGGGTPADGSGWGWTGLPAGLPVTPG